MRGKAIEILFLTAACLAFSVKTTFSQMSTTGMPTDSSLVLFLCGDVMTGRGIDQALPHSVDPKLYESYVKDARLYVQLAERKTGEIDTPLTYSYIWGDALEVLEKTEPALRIINLETSITNHEDPWPDKGINYRMHPKNAQIFSTANIDFCSLANNHTLDWQRPGLVETLVTLKSIGISTAGAGMNEEEAEAPAILNTEKGRVLVFAYGHWSSGIPESWAATEKLSGINYLDELSKETAQEISENIKALKKAGDVVIFSVHWGSNWGYDIPDKQVNFAHWLIDQGQVDIIHGHSSHHPRPIEVYKEKLILYGAGDFFNDYEGISGHETFRDELVLMYFPEIDVESGNLSRLKMQPMKIKHFKLNHVSEAEAKWMHQMLERESAKFGSSIILHTDNSLSLEW